MLVFRRESEGVKFFHFDSHAPSNRAVATALARKLWGVLMPGAGDPPSAAEALVAEASTPQQTNTSDCGAFAAAIADMLASGRPDSDIAALGHTAGGEFRTEMKRRIEEEIRKQNAAAT